MKINIDLREVVEEFNDLTSIQIDQLGKTILQAVTVEIYRNWTQEAKNNLHATRFEYLRNLQIVSISEHSKAIVLGGKLPNMLESGCSAFDLKEGFRKSAKVKYNKQGGWYLTIPFRFGTPGIVGESEVFTDILPQEIYNLLLKKRTQITSPYNATAQTAESLSAGELPQQYQAVGRRKEIIDGMNVIYNEYVHKSSIYTGIQRSLGIYENTQQGNYNSFRRAGQNSDPLSWIHSGIKAYDLADKALQNSNIDNLTENVIDAFLENI